MRVLLLTALFAFAALAGCVDDSDDPVIAPDQPAQGSEPMYDNVQPGTTTGFEHLAQAVDAEGNPMPTGAGIWVHGNYAYGSARSARMFIVDISDPAEPMIIYKAPEDSETVYARDADVIEHPDGRLTLVLATQFAGLQTWDVTNPYAPEFLEVTLVDPNHNVAVVPGTALVFNSQSGGIGRTNELIDLSDPSAPQVLGSYGTHGCHDITFFGTFGSEKFRAYCAGIQRTEIWNLDNLDAGAGGDFGIRIISTIEGDTLNSPVVGGTVFSSYPTRTLHHLAMVNEAGNILLVGDEFNGGGRPGACLLYEPTTGVSQPLGALWFYDLSDETNPRLLSWITPATLVPSLPPTLNPEALDPTNPFDVLDNIPNCTAHFGSLVPGEEKIVMAWYSAGVILIDFEDPSAPAILDQEMLPETNPWDAKIQDGYIFTGDIGRGLDVYKLV